MFIVKPAPRDEQRKRLYAAEREAKAFLRDPLPTIGEMQAFVDSILRSRWMQTYFAASVVAPIRVIGGRQRPATAMHFLSTISMPTWSRTKFLVIHEISHILAARCYGKDVIAAHGPEYATLFLELVGHFLGAEDASDLHEAFARCGVVHSYRGEEP
jgi:putative metallohydrolase (TIGR04338 family)